ncbi:unnamed protein product [Allacma fusca]|uniref:F-box domain-containing protein n=1 Tax=Allacma fusca TaxID=39272 RepID=A0A8J2JTZ7_9HEXA|nr:unnamed protein product [Allacma fusca]
MFRLLRFWKIKKNSSQVPIKYFQPDWVPEQIFEKIFSHLSGDDIKQCRLVCRTFEKTATTYLNETTCIIFDGNAGFTRVGFSKRKARRLIRYLTESEMKFSLWSKMRFRNICETHIKTLLQENVSRFANTMQNVTTVELIRCSLTWTTLIKFLHLFKNLETFIDLNNNYLAIHDPVIYCCQTYFDPEERTLIEVMDYKLHASRMSFSFAEPTWDIILMMRVLELTYFDWIFLGHSGFEQDLIPFVRRLKNLKLFTLMKVILQAGLGHLIEDIRPPSPQCIFNLGILLSDHPNLDEAAINRELLKTEVFTTCITALRVAIDLAETSNAGQVLPLFQQSCMYLGGDEASYNRGAMKFKNTTELMIKHIWNGSSSSFVSYNIHGIVSSFPNLTELCIFDGPKFEYLGSFRIRRQYDYMSEAAVMDLDMQLILKNLKRDNYDAVISMGGFKCSKEEILPYAVSNLKDLEEFVLKGVADGVTDVTAYFAFNGLQKLHTIAICGSTKLSKAAKEYLKQGGFSVNLNKAPRCEFT